MKQSILKPSLIAAAILGAAPLVQAQSNVTLYGRVDLGVQHSTKTAADLLSPVDAGKLTELYNGGILPSIWGLRGTEDLGSGLSAFFNLESHFNADTGTSVNGLFRRQANVGLKGGWGAVALGRQYSPALLAHLGTDPRGFKEQFSMLYPYAFNQFQAGGANDLAVFLGNAISYTGSFGPVNVGVAYAFGEQTGSTSNGSTVSIGGSYTGPVTVSASYQQIKLNNGAGDTKQFGLGAAVPVGPVKIKALFMRNKGDAGVLTAFSGRATETEVDAWGVGADYAWGANTTTLAYYLAKDRNFSADKTKTLVLSNDYALSKRTTLYAQIAYADAEAGATNLTNIIATPGLRGLVQNEKTAVFGVGVKHDF
ncbi:porin [Azohydromonas caseinilytica]|uniref:Porin n=1 Tax=Azohydromonas caseinilytica TaxID=2728836 RepID=A0A848FCE7_9BURK|nr:porin [Azohydromonas caseinilytica]NML15850.1 porin [Azohydromonas caseinilytica]